MLVEDDKYDLTFFVKKISCPKKTALLSKVDLKILKFITHFCEDTRLFQFQLLIKKNENSYFKKNIYIVSGV